MSCWWVMYAAGKMRELKANVEKNHKNYSLIIQLFEYLGNMVMQCSDKCLHN